MNERHLPCIVRAPVAHLVKTFDQNLEDLRSNPGFHFNVLFRHCQMELATMAHSGVD